MKPNPIERIVGRYFPNQATEPLEAPMFFLCGPRQIGKTFEAKRSTFPYYNWDTTEVKKQFLEDPYFFRDQNPWVVFDEIHKRRDWKKLMKGYFDSPSRLQNFLVTGSGRFNLSQRGGDSLQGRYDLFHMMPILYREYLGINDSYMLKKPEFKNLEFPSSVSSDSELIELGGFPEPLLKGTETFLNKWQDLYLRRLVQEDVRDFSRVVEIDKMEMLARILPERVRAPVSMKSLAEDLDVSRDSVKTWLRLFETLYLGFLLPPFTRKIHRAVKKEKKWFFFQWTFCEHEAGRFENYVATQLYALCQLWRDAGLGTYELFYLRDQDRREVDFVITRSLQPVALIEANLHETQWQSGLDRYARQFNVPSFIVTKSGPVRRVDADKWILPAAHLFSAIS